MLGSTTDMMNPPLPVRAGKATPGKYGVPRMEEDIVRRLVKIWVKDYPNICFSKDNVERFFARLEAGPVDMVQQVGNFIP